MDAFNVLLLVSVIVFMPQILKTIGYAIGIFLGIAIGILKVIR